MKTIIMRDPYPEEPGSLFPMVNISAFEAEKIATENKARLPTSDEYDRLFEIRPWPHLVWEWTSTPQVLRGGTRRRAEARVVVCAAYRDAYHPGSRRASIGFRLARDIPNDAPVPNGWITL